MNWTANDHNYGPPKHPSDFKKLSKTKKLILSKCYHKRLCQISNTGVEASLTLSVDIILRVFCL